MSNYPIGVDYVWLASDTAGRIAVFANAGAGPIPLSVLASRPQTDAAEALLGAMPIRGEFVLHIQYPRPDDYIRWARQGFYAYDAGEGAYERVASPLAPLTISDLSDALAALVGLTPALGCAFARQATLHEADMGVPMARE